MRKINGLDSVLLIDDDPAINFLHKLIIQNTEIDVSVSVIQNAKDALDFLGNTGKFSSTSPIPRPGIILLDINMPAINGWEFLDEFEKLPDINKQKIIIAMLTTSLNPEDEIRASKHKLISFFFRKPLSEEMFEKIVNAYSQMI